MTVVFHNVISSFRGDGWVSCHQEFRALPYRLSRAAAIIDRPYVGPHTVFHLDCTTCYYPGMWSQQLLGYTCDVSCKMTIGTTPNLKQMLLQDIYGTKPRISFAWKLRFLGPPATLTRNNPDVSETGSDIKDHSIVTWLTIDEVLIVNWIYWTLTEGNYK